ncbi:MAG: sigma-54 dependent transcriptional regulator [Thermoanaerobaculia bacterium]|nr:sigma-54 dependent transcriptional regulator [Thermoanaerobaculia bacterium]
MSSSQTVAAPPRLLVVEDRDSLRRLLRKALEEDGYLVDVASDGVEGIALAERNEYELVLTDLRLPGASGLEVLRGVKEARPSSPVVVFTAFGSVETAVEAMKMGAADFLEKPVEIDQIRELVKGWVTRSGSEDRILPDGTRVVGRHPRVRAALRLLERVAATDTTVLLLGESGTGKELFARGLHQMSARAEGPFVAVNCAAIPETLIENELFGHERGAFTGANRREKGRFEVAAGGTLLLDEIGELPLAVQGKVLRVLEERSFERVGSSAPLRADVRLVAATNRDLAAMVAAGEFRSDLFFRLEVFPIEIPALRDRASDVPHLARHLLRSLAERHRRSDPGLTPEAERVLQAQPWPGNVRQLSNVLERALILNEGGSISASEVEDILAPAAAEDEERAVRDALVRADGDKREAASLLGVSYRTLQRRIKAFDLEGFPKYRKD